MNPDDIDSDDPAWEALWTLSGAYLHQDYGADFDDWSAAARAYRSESDPSMVASAIEQIDVLLKNLSGDKEVEGRWTNSELIQSTCSR